MISSQIPRQSDKEETVISSRQSMPSPAPAQDVAESSKTLVESVFTQRDGADDTAPGIGVEWEGGYPMALTIDFDQYDDETTADILQFLERSHYKIGNDGVARFTPMRPPPTFVVALADFIKDRTRAAQDTPVWVPYGDHDKVTSVRHTTMDQQPVTVAMTASTKDNEDNEVSILVYPEHLSIDEINESTPALTRLVKIPQDLLNGFSASTDIEAGQMDLTDALYNMPDIAWDCAMAILGPKAQFSIDN